MGELDNFGDGYGGVRLDDRSPPAFLPLNALGLRFHHVAIAVSSIEKSLEFFVGILGFELIMPPFDVAAEAIRVCFLRVEPGVKIELQQAVREDSRLDVILRSTGENHHHICYEIDDLDAAIRILGTHDIFVLRRLEKPIQGMSRTAYFQTPDQQLFELVECDNEEDVSS